ncbi:iron-sulfur cluster biosynthesis family protein [Metabacillus lacus]|nr:iron-sulfur cluster biosynthesis family protein [Metabacillus lacus]
MIEITESAKNQFEKLPGHSVIHIPFDKGSCDIVNNVYEMKAIPNRDADSSLEEKITAGGRTFIVEKNFEDRFDGELLIDFSNNHFVFRNRNQIFNSRIRLVNETE